MRQILERARGLSRASLGVVGLLAVLSSGCYGTVAKIGVKLVGDAVNEEDVTVHEQKLMHRPLAEAEAEFGKPTEVLEETRTKREVFIYPVKDDVVSMFAWVVEARDGKIVDLSKVQRTSFGATEIVKKAMLEHKLIGKTVAEIQQDEKYERPELVLRSRGTGNLVRVYDVSNFTDLLGAKYCVLRFDASDRCESVRVVGVSASTRERSQ